MEQARLIAIVGPSGVGKTTLLRALRDRGGFAAGLEQHEDRPFQALFKQEPRYALANQLDYLLLRAEQEQELRVGPCPALLDGGLDLDFHGFTRLFHARGWLSQAEFDLCRRFYEMARTCLPPPENVIALTAAPETLRARLQGRARINIASEADTELLTAFVEEWLRSRPPESVLRLDVTDEDPGFARNCEVILRWLAGK